MIVFEFNNFSEQEEGISYAHRDYCGHGLYFNSGKFLLASVYDGSLETVIKEFSSEMEFIQWLSNQSDYSLR
jgi:hypothetical protein